VGAFARCGASALLFDASQAGLWSALRAGAAPPRFGAQLSGAVETPAVRAAAPPPGAACVEALLRAALRPDALPLPLRRAPGDVVTLVFTSGSTGAPKAAALTHASFAATTAAKLAVVGYEASDTFLHAAPLCHVGGLSSAHAALAAGAAHLFLPRWSAAEAVAASREQHVTALALVPTMLADMLAAADADACGPLRCVRRVLLGGGAAPRALLAAAAERLFPEAEFTATYALTEGGSSLAFRRVARAGAPLPPPPPPPLAASAGGFAGTCVGAPAPGIELAVALWPSGARAPPGTHGEILARGAQLMSGYWRDDVATQAGRAWGGDWLRTGDVGALGPDGTLWLAGRAKEIVKSGGESVHAAEVEAALTSHPAVAAAAVVPLPHARWGEAVAAAVLLRPGARWQGPWAGAQSVDLLAMQDACSEAEAQQHQGAFSPEVLREHAVGAAGLARFKAPRFVAAWAGPALPVGPAGKLSKAAVRDALLLAQRAQAAAPRARL
jgi:acyl-activating enzyme 14